MRLVRERKRIKKWNKETCFSLVCRMAGESNVVFSYIFDFSIPYQLNNSVDGLDV